jgi:hypothetical protein
MNSTVSRIDRDPSLRSGCYENATFRQTYFFGSSFRLAEFMQ